MCTVCPCCAQTDGNTALAYAAGFGHAEIVQTLLDAGANKDHVRNDGRKAIDVVCSRPGAAKSNKAAIKAMLS